MSSKSSANQQNASLAKVEQKYAGSTSDNASEITTGIDEKPIKGAPSKSDKVKGWAKSAKQWTFFADSTNPKQEQYAFYRWYVTYILKHNMYRQMVSALYLHKFSTDTRHFHLVMQ